MESTNFAGAGGKLDTEVAEDESSEYQIHRGVLENEILSIARGDFVVRALQVYATTQAADQYASRASTIASVARDSSKVKAELERGLRAIFNASGDKRLETFHWMVMRLDREHSASEIVDCFFDEAESQMNESEGEDKRVIAEVFGVGNSI